MIEVVWNNPRFELPTVINLTDYSDLTVGEVLVQLQNQFYHSIISYEMRN